MGLSVGSAFGDSKFVPVSTAEPPTVLDCCPIETRSTITSARCRLYGQVDSSTLRRIARPTRRRSLTL